MLTAVFLGAAFLYGIEPEARSGAIQTFRIAPGTGLAPVARELESARLIRSRIAFELLLAMRGSLSKLKPGVYELSPTESSNQIIDILIRKGEHEVTVTIPEGLTAKETDATLAEHGIIAAGELAEYARVHNLEGKLFPDTYSFYTHSHSAEVVEVLVAQFDEKVAPLLAEDPSHVRENLILASLVEAEVPKPEDQTIVAGILKKREAMGMPLQVDASICYSKEIVKGARNCTPLIPLDFKIDSPYNTYLYKGWPPGPIDSPGVFAVKAALHSQDSPYWFYLSNPVTKETIFSKTLAEHSLRRSLYLGIHK